MEADDVRVGSWFGGNVVMGGGVASEAGVVRCREDRDDRDKGSNFTQQITENLARVGLEKSIILGP